jgi:purine-nucleoside phosphorylase
MKEQKDQRIKETVRFLLSKTKLRPNVAVIFGSGLGVLAGALSSKKIIESSTIPHYPLSTVEGHHGRLIFGRLDDVPVLAFQGRIHFYETGDLDPVLYPIRVAHEFGIGTLIVTNAAGAVNRAFSPGDLMLVTDQVNLTFENPCDHQSGVHATKEIYDRRLQEQIRAVACTKSILLQEGVYCGLKGPSYETSAEIEMVRRIGCDAVGMSTVNEVSLAAALGMRVAGISCITNLATGINHGKLSHLEVTEVANNVKDTFVELLAGVIEKIK